MAQIYFSQPCECGCGKIANSTDRRLSRRRRFIHGHNSTLLSAQLKNRPPKPAPDRTGHLCECGCGTQLTTEPRFIKGHNARLSNSTAGGRGKVLRPDDPRGPNPSGLCGCGCGAKTLVTFDNHNGRVPGCYNRFLSGHDKITTKRIGGSGKCFCGCGLETPIALQSKLGNIAGQPQMYFPGHRWRTASSYTIDRHGCWILPVHRKDGYSRLHRDGNLFMGHRYYWEQRYGPIPKDMTLDHLCRQKACCCPDHMELCTQAENSRRVWNHPEIPKWGDWDESDIVVNPITGCWLFPIVQEDGYARFWKNNRLIPAHRFYYQRERGKIPAGLQLDHTCRQRNCVCPSHLEPVTRKENMRRAAASRAAAPILVRTT